ncbi:MAG: hypothetical protein J6Y90_06600 [Lachnospiraceae bacterium]|nr:hypothetical protein [Lachnospiraceae bacterium]
MNIDVFGDYRPRMNYWYSDGDKVPEIISFTQLLKWNYTEDYAAFIRYAYMEGSLPINYNMFDGSKEMPEITEVCIVEGYYQNHYRNSRRFPS